MWGSRVWLVSLLYSKSQDHVFVLIQEDTSDKRQINTELSQETHTEEDTSDKPHINT